MKSNDNIKKSENQIADAKKAIHKRGKILNVIREMINEKKVYSRPEVKGKKP